MGKPQGAGVKQPARFSLFGRLSPLGAAFAVAAFAADQAFKWWMLAIVDIAARRHIRLTPFFDLVLGWNRGVSYGWLASSHELVRWGLTGLSVAIVAVLAVWLARTTRALTAAGLGLVIGGALANAFDRVVHGAVADFFLFHVGQWQWYVFNLADVAIVAGVAALLYESWAEDRVGR